MSKLMNEREAWLWLAEAIERDDPILRPEAGYTASGLCRVVSEMLNRGLIDEYVFKDMHYRLSRRAQEVKGAWNAFLHTARVWHDGVRARYCREFAAECAVEELNKGEVQ